MIDIHTHLHPPKLFAAIRRWFAEYSDWKIAHQPTEPADVAAVLRENGVERFVFCSYAHKPGMARELNAWLAQTSRDLAGFGLPLATIHPEDPGFVDDLRFALDDGCIGLKLHEDVQRLAVDDPRLEPVFALLAERYAFALVHVGPIPWAFPKDEGSARIARVLEKHPELRLVVAHYGVPDTERFFELMDVHPHLFLDTTMVFSGKTAMAADEIDREELEFRASRIFYGTDFPNVPHAYDAERHGLEQLGLTGRARAAIFHDNAAALIGRALTRGHA